MRLLTKKLVRDKVGFSFAHIDRLENEGKFPKRVRIGHRVFWVEQELDAWIAEHVAKRTP